MTQNFITKMRRNKVVEETLIFTEGDTQNEIGRFTAYFKMLIEAVDDRIYEDVRAIEKIYYDPFVTDESVILKNLDKVEKLLAKKQKDYNEEMERYDKRTESLRGLAVDLAMLRKEKETLNERCDKLAKELHSL